MILLILFLFAVRIYLRYKRKKLAKVSKRKGDIEMSSLRSFHFGMNSPSKFDEHIPIVTSQLLFRSDRKSSSDYVDIDLQGKNSIENENVNLHTVVVDIHHCSDSVV